MKLVARLLTALCGLALSTAALAEDDYPTRPITLVVPLAAGSTADILARMVQPLLAQALGQTIVIDNRAGAGGTMAMQAVARAPADGYTLVVGSSGTWGINPTLYPKPGYDALKDFAPVAFLAGTSNVLVVPGNSSINSVADLVAALKRNPGKLSFASGGNGTTHHLSGELLKSMTGTFAMHIPYRGAPQGVTAVMTGEADFGLFNTPSVVGFVNDKRLKALGFTGSERSPLLPQVPTLQEAGIAHYQISLDFALLAPAATPPRVIKRLNDELQKIMRQPALRDKLAQQGFDAFRSMTPQALGKQMQQDYDKWGALVRRAKATVD